MSNDRRFAVIDPFPTLQNAETECIKRIEIAAANIGAECVIIDPQGLVRGTDKHIESLFGPDDIRFVIALHHSTPKVTRHHTYHAAWNPPEFLGFAWDYSFSVNSLLSCDDFLTYESTGINDHLDSLLSTFGRSLNGTSQLVTGCAGDIYEPSADRIRNGKLFYCGMNWERLGGKGRHHEIFHILDKHPDQIVFYGPELFQGIRPWGGYACYQGEIPFDGISMVQRLRDSGIVLALSATPHREAQAASNRVFEACAAGAFIIADDNAYLQRTFGDAIYTINYQTDAPEKTAAAILEALAWAKSHPEEATQMAKRCQEIYKARFTYEGQLNNILAHHQARLQTLGHCDKTSLSVVVPYTEADEEKLGDTLRTLARQVYQPDEIILVCSQSLKDSAEAVARAAVLASLRVVAMPADFQRAGFYLPPGMLSSGEMLAYLLPDIKSEYLAILLPGQEWGEIHAGAALTRIRAMEADIVVSAALKQRPLSDGRPELPSIEMISPDPNEMVSLANASILPVLGSLLLKTSFVREIPKINLRFMDHNFMASFFLLRGLCAGKVCYSGRATVWQSCHLLPENLICQPRVRTWQLWHIHDGLRAYPAWAQLRAAFRGAPSAALHTVAWRRLVINFLKRKLKAYPLLFQFAAKVLFYWRRFRLWRQNR